MDFSDKLFLTFQKTVPQAFLSRLVAKFANSENKKLKNFLIKKAIAKFDMNIDEAQSSNINDYKSFNKFFIRNLKDGARNIDMDSNTIVSSSDGKIAQYGDITDGTLIQAKGREFLLKDLLAEKENTEYFDKFMTTYLAPRDYHRIHMPIDGKLIKMKYIPGKLFSVNETTTANIDNVFAKNERLVCYFETKVGIIAVIFVGAMLVAGINVKWHGDIVPSYSTSIQEWDYTSNQFNIKFKKGEEIGYFKFGSTIVTLFPKNKNLELIASSDLREDRSIQMGERVAKIQ